MTGGSDQVIGSEWNTNVEINKEAVEALAKSILHPNNKLRLLSVTVSESGLSILKQAAKIN